MDDTTKQILAQAAGVMINGLFTYLAQQGLSPEEIDHAYQNERQKFMDRRPETLPDT